MPYVNKGLSTKICPFIEDVTGSIITINNQFNDYLLSLKATIEAIQQGSGDPSPDNVRPIVGVSEVNITQQVTDTPDRIYTINLGGTYYGGVLDVTSGVFTVADVKETFDLSDYATSLVVGNYTRYSYNLAYVPIRNNMQKCNIAPYAYNNNDNLHFYCDKGTYNRLQLYLPNDISSASIEVKYPLETPFEVQLTPTQVELAIRQNTIFADTGNLEAIYKTYTP